MSSSTPNGLLADAQKFLVAAELLRVREGFISLPGYFLLGRSIELSLKAYLMRCEVSINILRRREFGHDLSKLLDKALEKDIRNTVNLSEADIALIHVLNDVYSTKRYEYKETGATYSFPLEDATVNVAYALAYDL